MADNYAVECVHWGLSAQGLSSTQEGELQEDKACSPWCPVPRTELAVLEELLKYD